VSVIVTVGHRERVRLWRRVWRLCGVPGRGLVQAAGGCGCENGVVQVGRHLVLGDNECRCLVVGLTNTARSLNGLSW
jgi:hypothetical protein